MWIRLWIIVLYFCLFFFFFWAFEKWKLFLILWIGFGSLKASIWHRIFVPSHEIAMHFILYVKLHLKFHTIYEIIMHFILYIKLIFHTLRGNAMHFVFHIKFNLENFTLYEIVMQTLNKNWFKISAYTWDLDMFNIRAA